MTNIKVIVTDGIVTDVLTDSEDVEVEIVDIDKDYEDAKQLRTYEESLYEDKDLKSAVWTVARFAEEDE